MTSRRVTSIVLMTLTDETDFEEDKEIIINYDIVGKKAEITVTNPSEEYPVNVMIFDGPTNLLIEEHTFSTDKFTLDLSAKRQGIYLITASDGNVIQSVKILKD